MKPQVAPSTYSGYRCYVLGSICPYFDAKGVTLRGVDAKAL